MLLSILKDKGADTNHVNGEPVADLRRVFLFKAFILIYVCPGKTINNPVQVITGPEDHGTRKKRDLPLFFARSGKNHGRSAADDTVRVTSLSL